MRGREEEKIKMMEFKRRAGKERKENQGKDREVKDWISNGGRM